MQQVVKETRVRIIDMRSTNAKPRCGAGKGAVKAPAWLVRRRLVEQFWSIEDDAQAELVADRMVRAFSHGRQREEVKELSLCLATGHPFKMDPTARNIATLKSAAAYAGLSLVIEPDRTVRVISPRF